MQKLNKRYQVILNGELIERFSPSGRVWGSFNSTVS
ncbi:unnamed protein product [Prunus armeniaca]